MEVTFQAILNKIQTTADGGWRVTIDVSQQDREQVMKLSELFEASLQVAIIPFCSSDAV